MVIAFTPAVSGIAPEAVPLATVTPFTVIVALDSSPVGVTVMLLMVFATDAVYEVVPGANAGDKVPALKTMPARLSSIDGARVMVTV